MTLASVAGYGKLHGVSKAAAQKWQARGLLRFKDGKVDVEASDQSLAHAGVGRYADTATKARRTATMPPPEVAIPVAPLAPSAVADLEEAAAQGDESAATILKFMAGLSEGRTVDLITAQTIKENGLAAIRMIEARKRSGEVIELADAEAVLFDLFRHQRNAWLNFASRVGPLIAADLAVPVDKVVEVLTAHVHQHLTELGEPGDPFGQDQSAEADGVQGMASAAASESARMGR
ncbi:hypothetical protein [Brevundimonas sp.]|uniref:hypothetical protein n=1 Tax=Brevundimonas sp. TaxID=1871086 RepID=UPI002FCC6CC9